MPKVSAFILSEMQHARYKFILEHAESGARASGVYLFIALGRRVQLKWVISEASAGCAPRRRAAAPCKIKGAPCRQAAPNTLSAKSPTAKCCDATPNKFNTHIRISAPESKFSFFELQTRNRIKKVLKIQNPSLIFRNSSALLRKVAPKFRLTKCAFIFFKYNFVITVKLIWNK